MSDTEQMNKATIPGIYKSWLIKNVNLNSKDDMNNLYIAFKNMLDNIENILTFRSCGGGKWL